MLIKGIDVPDDLLRAQAAGDLVIFAGAGVSKPPPSSLPLFGELAAQIGNGTGLEKDKDDPEDRYLGRLKKHGVRVHEAAAQILVNENTKPHELHHLLIQLFPAPDKVRIVTTNFDTHFSSASEGLFSGGLEVFYSPALPLGDDFAGLVYLHGCAGKELGRCVLTDEDFGRAYLTQAWASRFLAAMFARYVVLFVGYSHNDTVMNYLARGLPPVSQKPRYAFTTDDTASLSKWEFLGVKPLIYKKSNSVNPHQAITDSVNEWVKEQRRGLLEKAERIRSITTGQPPLEGEDADYIKFSLADLDTARIFFKHAKAPGWISWLEKHGFIKPIFDKRKELDQIHRELAFWLVESFLAEHSQDLLAVIERQGGELQPQFCWFIWRRLATREKNPVASDIFCKWIAVLLAQPFNVLQSRDWAALLADCRLPDDKAVFVLLFDLVTKPRVILSKAWRFLDAEHEAQDQVEFDLNLLHHGREGEYWVTKAWNDLIKPNLATYAGELEPIVVSNLMAAYKLMCLSRPTHPNRDPLYAHRQVVHSHEQNSSRYTIDTLIDAARGILDHLLETTPRQADAQIEKWFGSDVPILRRLAIYGVAKNPSRSPDEKLQWIIQNNLVYEFKADVFWFLQQCYAAASETTRRQFIEIALRGPIYETSSQDDKRTEKYETFNLFVWLRRIAPECEVAEANWATLKRENQDFGEREHPEFDFWSDGVRSVDPTEGINLDEIQRRTPANFLDELLAWKQIHPFGKSRASYCSAVSATVAKQPEWGVAWIEMLVSRKLVDSDLWRCVCQGWRNANLSSDGWKVILGAVEKTEAPPEFFEAFAEVLEHGSRRETHTLPDDMMEQAQRIAERIWDAALKSSPVEGDLHKDWLSTAINRPGGKIAEFWLQRVSSARKAAGEAWHGLPPSIADKITEMLRGTSGAAAHARILFASQLHYFFSLDAAFAQRELLPLFDWQRDALCAEQCWHGFLFWGRWLPGFTERLLPQFNEAVNRMKRSEKDARDHVIHHLAGVALFRLENPLADNWLPTLLQRLNDAEQIMLAADIDQYLREADVTVAETIWERWLSAYWELRLLNKPKPVLPKEAVEMVCWVVSVGRHFPQAVSRVPLLGQNLHFEHSDLFWRIDEKKGLVRAHPDAAADLVLFYLQSSVSYFYLDEHIKNVWRDLCEAGVAPEKLKKIREAMIRLGQDPGQP